MNAEALMQYCESLDMGGKFTQRVLLHFENCMALDKDINGTFISESRNPDVTRSFFTVCFFSPSKVSAIDNFISESVIWHRRIRPIDFVQVKAEQYRLGFDTAPDTSRLRVDVRWPESNIITLVASGQHCKRLYDVLTTFLVPNLG